MERCRYRLAADPDRLQRDLDTLFALHRSRWDGAETPFLRAERFHREFAAQALERGWLRLWFLGDRRSPRRGALRLSVRGCRVGAIRPAATRAARDHPVGFVLLAHAVRAALEDGMVEYRLLRGGAAYKERFATADPGIETYGLPRGAAAEAVLAAALATRGRSLGLRRILDRP